MNEIICEGTFQIFHVSSYPMEMNKDIIPTQIRTLNPINNHRLGLAMFLKNNSTNILHHVLIYIHHSHNFIKKHLYQEE